MKELQDPRAVDHVVLPVSHIDGARTRYEKLGFIVAPDGQHPFGTENCCIFFSDGTFLEPLGIAQRETCEEQAIAGNSFVRNDQKYRFRRGLEGFSHLVLKSDDAPADHAHYCLKGMSGGDMVEFSRGFETPSGEKGEVSFKLAFAADVRSPDADFFTCQVINPPKIDRSSLFQHSNGVVGLKEVILSEVNPTDFQYFFQDWLNQREMGVDSFGMSFHADNADVVVLSPDGMKAVYGMDVETTERGLLFQAFVLIVKSLSALEAHLENAGVDFTRRGNRVIVSPAKGQGTTIMFEEINS